MINLDTIQEMWTKDSKIDIDNLHTESLNIPILHAKYFDLYNTIVLLRKKAEQQKEHPVMREMNTMVVSGDPEVYVKDPFPKKIRDKDTMQKYLDADERLSGVSLKIEYYDTMLKYLEEILKMISNRTYQIKNSIEFMRFNAGTRMNEEYVPDYTIDMSIADIRCLYAVFVLRLQDGWW